MKTPNFIAAQLLTDMKNVGASFQRVPQADAKLNELKDAISSADYEEVRTAVAHYRIGEGREELDKVCNRLINKYKGLPPDRKSMICA